VLAFAGPAAASPTGHSDHHGKMDTASAASAPMTDGEVRKIDKDAGKVTLKHGPIKNLDMPPMTMVFQVKDRALLDKVKVGDKVRFAAEQSTGAYIVTAIESVR
jgi:Cu/Ag efflux protein CusF